MHGGFSLQALSSSLSDHCPLFLCHHERPVIRESFRFENFWPRVPGIRDVVMGAWNESVPGVSSLNILFFKFQWTAVRRRQCSKKLFGNARIELHMANEIIHRLDLAQDHRELSQEDIVLRRDLKNRVLGVAAVERAHRRQASRMI
jgi:hypothetical protein